MKRKLTNKEINETLHWVLLDQLLDEMGAPKQVGRGTLSPFGRLQRLRNNLRAEKAALEHALNVAQTELRLNGAHKAADEVCGLHSAALLKIVKGGYADGADRAHPAIAVARAALAGEGSR